MVRPRQAAVRPRVISPDTGESIAMDDVIAGLIEAGARGTAEIWGPDGSGKTTALEHLAAAFGPAEHVVLLDQPDAFEVQSQAAVALVVFTSNRPRASLADRSYALAPWTDDDIIEYLLAMHAGECRSVVRRLEGDGFRRHVRGAPRLWSIIMDEMARAEEVADTAITSLRRRSARRICVARICAGRTFATRISILSISAERDMTKIKPSISAVAMRSSKHMSKWSCTTSDSPGVAGNPPCFQSARVPVQCPSLVGTSNGGYEKNQQYLRSMFWTGDLTP